MTGHSTRVKVELSGLPYEVYGFVRGERYEDHFEFRHKFAFEDPYFLTRVFSLLNDTEISRITSVSEGVYMVFLYGGCRDVMVMASELFAAIELICEDQEYLTVDFFITGLLKLKIVESALDLSREAVKGIVESRREEFDCFVAWGSA